MRLSTPKSLAPFTVVSWASVVLLCASWALLGACSGTAAGSPDDAAAPLPDSSMGVDASEEDAAVVTPDGCVPTSCGALGHACGDWDDGCGQTLSCGGCDAGETCDAGQCEAAPVDCAPIANHPTFELCDSSPTHCAGVFTNYEGCTAFCAAAGLVCSARNGGEPGCLQEPQIVLSCGENNGHQSDWCVCGVPTTNPTCNPDPLNPPVYQDMHYNSAVFGNRSAWVLECYDYAYTAFQSEHEACDSQYQAGSAQGTATFTFNVGPGEYDVYIEGRHTANRNPAGALVTVTSNGQTYSQYIMQRDSTGVITLDLHGRYCLDGQVVVVMDSTVSTASDSVRRVVLEPVP